MRAISKAAISLAFCSVLLTIPHSGRLTTAQAENPETPTRSEMTKPLKLEIPPQEYSYLKYDAASGRISQHNSTTPAILPDNVTRAIGLAPEWLRDGLSKRFQQLRNDYVWTNLNATLAVADINKDNCPDLVLGGQDGKLKVYLGPGPKWQPDERGIFNHINAGEDSAPAFADVNNDKYLDLVIGNKNGVITAYAGPQYRDIIASFPAIKLDGPAQPVFIDINNDKKDDLIIYSPIPAEDSIGKTAKLYCYSAPDWKDNSALLSKITPPESGRISAADIDYDNNKELVFVDKEGRITAYNSGTLQKKQGWWETNQVNQPISIALLDADGDGDLDVVCGRANGIVKYYPNNNGFMVRQFERSELQPTIPGSNSLRSNCQSKVFNQNPRLLFPTEVGQGAIPFLADFNGDKKVDLLVANSDGSCKLFTGPDFKEDTSTLARIKLPDNPAPAIADINGDGKLDIISGSKSEQIKCFLAMTPADELFSKLEDLPKYSAPAFMDIDKDGDLDLLVGGEDGRIALYPNTGSTSQPQFAGKPTYLTAKLKEGEKDPVQLKVSGASVPRAADVNGDGNPDIIVGGKDGRIALFLGPDWTPDTVLIESVSGGSYCAPAVADINGDGQPELVVTNSLGELAYYELVHNGVNKRWEERYSWKPSAESDTALNKIYGFYYSETMFMQGQEDKKAVDEIARVLQEAPENHRDEVAFAIANLPAEILRAMVRLKQSDLLNENARMIYEVAAQVSYIRIKEKGDYTTLEYAVWAKKPDANDKSDSTQAVVWHEMPRDIYYWWVVQPRILYEIPCRIDGSWLEKTAKDYGLTQDNWWSHQEDWYVQSKESRFWRMAMPYDRSNGTPLIERMKRARTLDEAVNQLHTWSSPQAPQPFVTFGYLSDDLQPWIIYKRRYGSCGEQSIITAALARSMLIPTASVFTRGEDHQWNEFWMDDKWHFWDVCGNAYQAVDRVWEREGYTHTGEASAIMRYWSNDYFDYTTATVGNPDGSKYTPRNSGYTDVGYLTIRVLDCDGRPIEGALVNFRRPGAVDMLTALGYTDLYGECLFELGKVSAGYTIFALTPYGSAGTKNYVIEEGKSYTLEYRVAGKKYVTAPAPDKTPSAEWVEVSSSKDQAAKSLTIDIDKLTAAINPPCRFAITRWTDYNKELQKINFRGSITAQYPLLNGSINILALDKANFELYAQAKPFKALDIKTNPRTVTYPLGNRDLYFVFCNRHTEYATELIDLKYTYNAPLTAPRITVDKVEQTEIPTGQDLTINGTAVDNIGIKTLEISFDNGQTFHDATGEVKPNSDRWSCSLQKFIGGPVPAEKYYIIFKATNYGGLSAQSAPIALTVRPNRVFTDQVIRQDSPDSPLPTCSWMVGPFILNPQLERFVDIQTTCQADGTDIDLFLFRDKNNDGKINGMEEKETASTSPTANERISLTDVVTGTYWIYAQGWKVEQDSVKCNINLSFYPQPEVIGGKLPNAMINQAKPEISARLASISDFNPYKFIFKLDGTQIPTGWILTRTGVNYVTFSYPVDAALADASKHTAELTVTDYLGRTSNDRWEFQVDLTAPKLSYVKAREEKPGVIALKAETEDNVNVTTVSYKMNKLSGTLTAPDKSKGEEYYTARIDTLSLDNDEYELVVTSRDKAGNSAEKKTKVEVRNPPARIFYTFPTDNETVYALRPLVLASYKSEHGIKTKDIRIWLDDREITADALITADTLRYQPVTDLALGKHAIRITLRDTKGNKASYESTFELQVEPGKK